ncbi:gamma-glutamyl-gamma-aminobutyrate hydrolase family protein [Oscillibacter sp. GMB15532]|uniref:gamma-glutamyl-gamma-aminobutyrate hydrolase family protein n=1 Tax=Oscillibacter sp. GMB15532 TaxID=3230022 RepID=UPI0034E02E2D
MSKKKPAIGMVIGPSPALMTGKHIVNTPYIQAIVHAGGTPLLLPVTGDPATANEYIDLLDGLLIPGGADVTPTLYGEDSVPQVTYMLEDQDRLELALIHLASERQMPIFGICRGIQLLNVAFGGTLYQDIPSQCPGCIGHSQDVSTRSQMTHRVQLVPGSLMEQLLGAEPLFVNSYHHQAIKELAPGFSVSACAADGVVEAFENEARHIYAVQWHPEELVDRYDRFRPLFRHLVEEAGK